MLVVFLATLSLFAVAPAQAQQQDPVTNLVATSGVGKLTVTWTNPSGSTSASHVNFVRWREQGTSSWSTSTGLTLRTSYEITSLMNGTTYEVEVRVRSGAISPFTFSNWVSTTGTTTLTVSLSAAPNPVTEGSPVTVTATLSAALTRDLSIPVTLTAGTAEPDDYGTLTSISISSGQTSGTGTITTAQDTDTDNETFTVSLGTPPSGVTAGTPGSVVITIRDDDVSYPPPALRELSLFASDKGRFASRGNYVDLEPTFHEDTLNYTVRVDDWVGYIRVGAEARDSNPEDPTKVFINGKLKVPFGTSRPQAPDPSTSYSIWVQLKDVTPIEIVVRNPLGESRTYTVRVLRGNAEVSPAQTPPAQTPPEQTPPEQTPTTGGGSGSPSGGGGGGPAQSSDASLGTLEIQEASLDFDPDTNTYTLDAYGETSLTLTPTASDSGARITVDGETVRSGMPHTVTLDDDGVTVIEIVVTAEDGSTRTYTLTVVSSCPGEEKKILEMFYDSTQGDMWEQSGGWNTEDDLGDWHGVITDEDGTVISLRLEDNGLSGDIPSALLCFEELSGLLELALWDNEDLPGEVPDDLVPAVERAVLRDVAEAEALNLNPGWFDDYEVEDLFDFHDWHEGVMTDERGRVTELDFTGEGITGEIPGSVFELKRLMLIKMGCEVTLEVEAPGRVSVMMAEGCEEIPDETPDETPTSGDGGCALSPEGSSAFSLFLLTLFVFAAMGRRRVLISRLPGNKR